MKKQEEIGMIAIRLSSLSNEELNDFKELIKNHDKSIDLFSGKYRFAVHLNLGGDTKPLWLGSLVPRYETPKIKVSELKEFLNS